jgi:hypothetical protein
MEGMVINMFTTVNGKINKLITRLVSAAMLRCRHETNPRIQSENPSHYPHRRAFYRHGVSANPDRSGADAGLSAAGPGLSGSAPGLVASGHRQPSPVHGAPRNASGDVLRAAGDGQGEPVRPMKSEVDPQAKALVHFARNVDAWGDLRPLARLRDFISRIGKHDFRRRRKMVPDVDTAAKLVLAVARVRRGSQRPQPACDEASAPLKSQAPRADS